MYGEIDIEKLREDISEECYAGSFAGGMEEMGIGAMEVENASDKEVIQMAKELGINLWKYRV